MSSQYAEGRIGESIAAVPSTAAYHQLVCTHCTKQSSALHRIAGPAGDEVAGYSVRATSLPYPQEAFDRIRPLLHYQLPLGADEATFRGCPPELAPQRLLYRQLDTGQRLMGLVSYRSADATGHATGSYFAHFLMADSDSPIRPIDCLTLWGADCWLTADADLSVLPHDLPKADLLHETQRVGEPLLEHFLTAEGSTLAVSAGQIVPERWLKQSPRMRQSLLQHLLEEFLEAHSRRRRMVVIAEPEFAAFLFYGILRFLPDASLARSVDFSLYESSPAESPYALTATCTATPVARRVLLERAQRDSSLLVDTFRQPPTITATARRWQYVREAFDPFQEKRFGDFNVNGWSSVDLFLIRFGPEADGGARTLECLSRLGALAEQLITSGTEGEEHSAVQQLEKAAGTLFQDQFPDLEVTTDDLDTLCGYLRRAIWDYLCYGQKAPRADRLRHLVSSPQFLSVIDLMAAEPKRSRFVCLLAEVRPTQIERLLLSAHVPLEDKLWVTFSDFADASAYDGFVPPELHQDRARLFSLLLHHPQASLLFDDLIAAARAGNLFARRCLHQIVDDISVTALTKLLENNAAQVFRAFGSTGPLPQRLVRPLQDVLKSRHLSELHQQLTNAGLLKSLIKENAFQRQLAGWEAIDRQAKTLKKTHLKNNWKAVGTVVRAIDAVSPAATCETRQQALKRVTQLFQFPDVVTSRLWYVQGRLMTAESTRLGTLRFATWIWKMRIASRSRQIFMPLVGLLRTFVSIFVTIASWFLCTHRGWFTLAFVVLAAVCVVASLYLDVHQIIQLLKSVASWLRERITIS